MKCRYCQFENDKKHVEKNRCEQCDRPIQPHSYAQQRRESLEQLEQAKLGQIRRHATSSKLQAKTDEDNLDFSPPHMVPSLSKKSKYLKGKSKVIKTGSTKRTDANPSHSSSAVASGNANASSESKLARSGILRKGRKRSKAIPAFAKTSLKSTSAKDSPGITSTKIASHEARDDNQDSKLPVPPNLVLPNMIDDVIEQDVLAQTPANQTDRTMPIDALLGVSETDPILSSSAVLTHSAEYKKQSSIDNIPASRRGVNDHSSDNEARDFLEMLSSDEAVVLTPHDLAVSEIPSDIVAVLPTDALLSDLGISQHTNDTFNFDTSSQQSKKDDDDSGFEIGSLEIPKEKPLEKTEPFLKRKPEPDIEHTRAKYPKDETKVKTQQNKAIKRRKKSLKLVAIVLILLLLIGVVVLKKHLTPSPQAPFRTKLYPPIKTLQAEVYQYHTSAVKQAMLLVNARFNCHQCRTKMWLQKAFNNMNATPEAKCDTDFIHSIVNAFSSEMGDEENHLKIIQKIANSACKDSLAAILEQLTFLPPAQLTRLRVLAYKSDEHFLPPVKTLGLEDIDSIVALGGGSTLTFKLIKNGKIMAAFKPLQLRRQSNYRSEIAAWRLCQMIKCSFRIPYNAPIRILKSDFLKLFSKVNNPKQRKYRRQFSDIEWVKKDDNTYIYGTFKAWVPNFTRFPIEIISMWKPWLSVNEAFLDEPLGEALKPIRNYRKIEKLYDKLLFLGKETTKRQLAQQISDLLVFDFLVGNWDRFSGVKAWWGVNCQFTNNHIISIDNGAAFQTYSHEKVIDNWKHIERFSVPMYTQLKMLDAELLTPILFPNATTYEQQRITHLLKQRDLYLRRIEKLIRKHGHKEVLFFP